MRSAHAFASLLASVVLSVASSAASAPSARLVYLRGAGTDACPDEEAMRAAVATRLGYDPFLHWAKNTVFAEIKLDKGDLVGHVKLVDDSSHVRGEREISQPGTGCSDLAHAMALTISIAIDPLSLMRVAPESEPAPSLATIVPESPPPPQPQREPSQVVPAEQRTPAPAASPSRWQGGVGVHGTIGMAPTAAVGVDVFGGVRWRAISGELGGRIDFPASVDRAGGRASSSVIGGTLAGCVHRSPIFGCGMVLLGVFSASGELGVSRRASALYAASGLRLGAAVPLWSGFELRLPVDLLVTLTRHTLQVDGADVLTLPPLSATAGLGVAAAF